MQAISSIADWPFLQEPMWRWAIFVGAILAFLWGWSGVIDLMK